MKQVKIFSHCDTSYELESKINEFLATKSKYFTREAINVSLSTYLAGYHTVYCGVLLYNEEKTNE